MENVLDLKEVKTEEQALEFFNFLEEKLGLSWHPDTPFSDYIITETEEATFTPEEVSHLDDLMEQAFALFEPKGDDAIYSFALDNSELYKKLISE